MKKRILAFALTLAMVVTSLSMLSFVSFAEVAPDVDDDANEEISTVLMAGYTAKEPVKVTSSATATATYSLVSGNITINVAATDLASVKANIGGYAATATATAGAATIAVPFNEVVIYKDATNNAVADLQLIVTTASDETFNGTLVFVTNDATNLLAPTALGGGATGAAKLEANGHVSYRQAAGATPTTDSCFNNLGQTYGQKLSRITTFDFCATDMKPVDVANVSFNNTFSATALPYDRILMVFLAAVPDNTPIGRVDINIVNTTNGGSEGQASLVLVYRNLSEGNKDYIIPLDKTLNEQISFEILWDYPTFGYIKVDDKIVLEKDDIRTSNTNGISAGTPSGYYFRILRGDSTSTNAFNFDITNFKLNTKTHAHTTERVLAAGAKSTGLASEGSIKLSYVQDSTPMSRVGNSIDGNTAGNGGAVSADKTTMSVNNTADRAYAQSTFKTLGILGNRSIEFTLNVANLRAYDFSNAGTLTGDAKYTENIEACCGTNQGIGYRDLTVHAYDKLLIGAVSDNSLSNYELAAMVFWVVNDTEDGLVLVHTDYNGNETVMYIGDKINQDVAISIVWNSDNTGSVKIGNNVATAFDECRTVVSNFTEENKTTVQCYFANCGGATNGYFGLNSVRGTSKTAEGYVAPNASLKLTNVTNIMPLDVRFVATIDTLDAKEAGFEINLKGSDKVVKAPTTEAYKAITSNTAYDVEKIYAPDGKYFVAVTINNVPAEGTVTFVVKPYFTYAGETTYGTAYEVTYVNGVYSGAVAVAN